VEKPPTFRDLPAVAVLPEPPAAGQAAEPFSVGKLHVRERAPWIAQLDGGDGVIPNAELALARDEGRAYVVRLTPRDQTASAIARFWFDDKASTLKFQWLEAAATTPNAAQLRLCQLRLTIDGESKSVAFSKPIYAPPLEFDLDKKNDRIVIDADDLPDDKLLRFEITTIEGIDLKVYPFETQPAGPVEAKKPITLTLKRLDRDRNGQPIGILQVNFLPSRKGLTVSRRIDQPPRRMLAAAQVPMARQQVEEEFKKTLDQMKKADGHGAKDKFLPFLNEMEKGLGQLDLLELVDKQVKIHYRVMLQAGNHRVPLYDSQAEAPPAAP
ncbi:MAG: hypothetical protein U1E05_06270, partial [Patescibacteria group bacterium]|nr:hypothetical protein [Patescibacteria group bacterium]